MKLPDFFLIQTYHLILTPQRIFLRNYFSKNGIFNKNAAAPKVIYF